MASNLKRLEEIVFSELQTARKQAHLARQSANEISKAAAASPSQSGDREHSKNQAYITEDRLKNLEKVYQELQNKDLNNSHQAVSPPIFLTVRMNDTKQHQFYLLSSPLHLKDIRIVSISSPLGRSLKGKTIGDVFKYKVDGNIIRGKITNIEI